MSASPPRVCLIGNSFLGAVRRAYEDLPDHDNYSFSFFASGGPAFEKISIVKNTIINAAYHSGGSQNIEAYDYFVVYGDAPTPRSCIQFMRSLSQELYSAAVRKAALDGWMSQSKAIRVVHALRNSTDRPIFVLPRNVNRNENIGTRAENAEGVAVMTSVISPCKLVEFPKTLFLENGRPNPEYYQGSLDIAGEEPNRSKQPRHHDYHFNATGGAVILGEIIKTLDALGQEDLSNAANNSSSQTMSAAD